MATISLPSLRSVSTPPPFPRSVSVWPVFVLVGLLIAATRLPLAPRYLYSFDEVNFALALERFDPGLHQPQPPGYPLFIAEARLLKLVLPSPEAVFAACRLIAGVLAPPLLFLLGARMYSAWAGMAAALLLTLDPIFWRSTLASPLRPYLSVFAVLVAYLCYRAANGEKRFAYYSALALGLGSGWRPGLIVFLFPLWLFCAYRGTRSARRVTIGIALLSAATLTWVVPLVIVTGGPFQLWDMLSRYLEDQSRLNSPVYGGGFWEWWKMLTRAFVWDMMSVVGWLWAAILLLIPWSPSDPPGPPAARVSPVPRWLFLLIWIAPPLVFFALIHVASPGHTLSVAPALCLAGGACLERGAVRLGRIWARIPAPRAAFLAVALGINLWLFLYPFRIPHARPQIRGTLPQVAEQFRFWGAFALREGSYAGFLAEDLKIDERMRFLHGLGSRSDFAIVWQDDDVSWRIINYYFPHNRTWVLEGISGAQAPNLRAPWLWKENKIISAPLGDEGDPLVLPATGRIAWLLHLHSHFPEELRSQGVRLTQFGTLYLSDSSSMPAAFRAGPFRFQKQPATAEGNRGMPSAGSEGLLRAGPGIAASKSGGATGRKQRDVAIR